MSNRNSSSQISIILNFFFSISDQVPVRQRGGRQVSGQAKIDQAETVGLRLPVEQRGSPQAGQGHGHHHHRALRRKGSASSHIC
jgi:hypothetical protein